MAEVIWLRKKVQIYNIIRWYANNENRNSKSASWWNYAPLLQAHFILLQNFVNACNSYARDRQLNSQTDWRADN